ncbi:hypothetical protein INR49_020121 [Caranx melampygus]|nr:hypothetical protein INR49_020121 [Caranx melampygus]
MSESIRRRSSSRQLLQNLIRVTAQRSQEDAEEVERERRRRAREKQRGEGSPSCPEAPHHNDVTHNMELDEELKPSCCLVLEEDEGFSDWSHRLEQRSEHEVQYDSRARQQTSSAPQWKPRPEEGKRQDEEEQRERERGCEPERSSRPPEASTRPPEKDTRLQHASGQPADRTSYLAAGTMRPRGATCRVDGQVEKEELKVEEEEAQKVEEVQPTLEGEWRSVETQQSPGDEDDPEEEELSFTHDEREDLHLRREQRHREEEEEEEEAEQRMTEKDEVNNRVSTDGKCKILERTESLRKSTSNSKKSPPPVAVSKIDKKLEQYTHALEVSSKEGRPSSQGLTDLTSPTEPVASKKNLFEAGEAWNQNTISVAASKEIKPGGVLNKKNLWESLGDAVSPGRDGKESSPGKRYKFVVTGHGKYEKVPVDTEDGNCPSVGHFFEDL